MVFSSRGRGRGGLRGRGRGVGGVSFESRPAHPQGGGRETGQAPESLRITVGNDQFQDRHEESISATQRLGPPKDNYMRDREPDHRREDEMYRREAEIYGQVDRDRYDRDRSYDRRDQYSRDPYLRPEEREYGDRRGLGGGGYEQTPSDFQRQPGQQLFPSASQLPPVQHNFPPAQPVAQSTSGSSRPLKSILKKKPEPVQEKPPPKPSGLPGIANYMDDIEDEDKFLYGGGGDDDRRGSDRDGRESGPYRQIQGVAVEEMRPNIRSVAQTWQPTAPEKTVSGVVSQFVNAQREIVDNSYNQQYRGADPYASQPTQTQAPEGGSGGNDLWSMLAKSVQTVQQQQNPQTQYDSQRGGYQQQFNEPPAQPSFTSQQSQDAPTPGAAGGHDPTIENILKSIGFDFEMSKRMQEKAKQGSGEAVPQAQKPGDPEFINQNASFIGSQMSHEDMVSQLGYPHQEGRGERQPEGRQDERRTYEERDCRDSREASRGRYDSPSRRMSSPTRRTVSPPRSHGSQDRRTTPEKLQRGCSPVSAEGSPPPPIFNLPPITIKRRTNIDRSGSPGWEKNRSLSRSPTRDSDRSRNKKGSRSPSWNHSISGYGRKRSVSPHSPRKHSRSPSGRVSPVIKRTFNLDDLSSAFKRRVSPGIKQRRSLSPVSPERTPDRRPVGSSRRSISPGRRRSPGRRNSRSPDRKRSRSPGGRRSPGRRSRSPGRRRSRSPGGRRSPGRQSRSPGRRRSRSPGRRRSRSPGRRSSRSPGRRRSPRRRSPSPRGRRRSPSPRGRKRGPSSRSRSRERKVRRSLSRDRSHRDSPGRRRSSSRDRSRKRSRSPDNISVSSDSDVDGPANKNYFSSPLRLSRTEKQNIPRYYDYPPPGSQPNMNVPTFANFAPPLGSFPPGVPPPGMIPVGPPGPPQMMGGMPIPPPGMPPPAVGPPIGPPVSYTFPPPGAPGVIYTGPPILGQPPPLTPDPNMAPPGTEQMPLNLPIRSNIPEHSDDRKEDRYEDRSRRDNRSEDRYDDKSRREERRRDRSRSRERTRDRRDDHRDDRRNEKSSSSSNRTVLPPKSLYRAEDIEIKASTTSSERVVVLGGKSSKQSSTPKDSKKAEQDKEKAKIKKEKEEKTKIMSEKVSMVSKIKALEMEFNNLKKQEFDLRKRTSKDNKPDPILIENKKLLEEIRKEIAKLKKQKTEFESKHSSILKVDSSTRREIKVTPKKPIDEISKSAEKEEFKVEKGKLMKHYFHDAGDHWCKPCNSIHPNVQDFMHHLSSYKHKQTLASDFRPWMDGYKANDGMIINKKGIRVPLPGVEFMMPVSAFYCQLCKVFLGDVSFGADHFKCESHYINYKKYLAENPMYEKMYKEERNKALPVLRAEKQADQEQKLKEDMKQRDVRVRENEKKWDKTVDDLDDINTTTTKRETSGKSQIKLSLKDKKSESNEKGFGKFNWTKDKKSEDSKSGQKTPEAGQDKDKAKINFNISGKSSGVKTIVGKTGAPRKNPLLPPWQPVGKKAESVGKPGETASLDQFLTTNSGEGKIPVIAEKKKFSAKDILEAFSGKYKDKDNEPNAKKESQTSVKDQKEEKTQEIEPPKSKEEIQEEDDKRMMGIDPDSEVPLAVKIPPPPRSQNVPLPDQKPSATVSENDVHKIFNSEKANEAAPAMDSICTVEIPLPDSETKGIKPASVQNNPLTDDVKETVDNVSIKTEVKTDEVKEIPTPETTDLTADAIEVSISVKPDSDFKDIIGPSVDSQINGGGSVVVDIKIENEKETNNMSVDDLSSEKNEYEIMSNEQVKNFFEAENVKIEPEDAISAPEINIFVNDSLESSLPVNKSVEDPVNIEVNIDQPMSDSNAGVSDAGVSDVERLNKDISTVESLSEKIEEQSVPMNVEEVGNSSKHIISGEPLLVNDIKDEDQVSMATDAKSNTEDTVDGCKPANEVAEEIPNTEVMETVSVQEKTVMETEKSIENKGDDKSEESNSKCASEEKEIVKDDDSDTEIDEEFTPSPKPARGRGRGRGRKRGRGRGRGKAASTPTRSTRSSKALKADDDSAVSVELEIMNPDIKSDDNVSIEPTNKDTESVEMSSRDFVLTQAALGLNEMNKSFELNSGVKTGKTKKLLASKRKTSVKGDDAEGILDDSMDDAQSDASGVSMHMDSDFEVVDDLEEMEVLDEAVE